MSEEFGGVEICTKCGSIFQPAPGQTEMVCQDCASGAEASPAESGAFDPLEVEETPREKAERAEAEAETIRRPSRPAEPEKFQIKEEGGRVTMALSLEEVRRYIERHDIKGTMQIRKGRGNWMPLGAMPEVVPILEAKMEADTAKFLDEVPVEEEVSPAVRRLRNETAKVLGGKPVTIAPRPSKGKWIIQLVAFAVALAVVGGVLYNHLRNQPLGAGALTTDKLIELLAEPRSTNEERAAASAEKRVEADELIAVNTRTSLLEAELNLRQAIDLDSTVQSNYGRLAECQVLLGMKTRDSEMMDNGERLAQAVLEVMPDDLSAMRARIFYAGSVEVPSNAKPLVRAYQKASPDTVEGYYLEAWVSNILQEWKPVDEALKKAFAKDPEYIPAKITQAEAWAAQGRLAEAKKILEDVLAKRPDMERARRAAADLGLAINEPAWTREQAETMLARRDLKPEERTEWRLVIVQSFLLETDYKNALGVIAQAIAESPDNGELYLRSGDIKLQMGQPVDALLDYNKASSMMPDSPVAWLHIAKCDMALEKFDAARQAVEKAAAIAPENIEVTLLQGELALNQEKFGEARQAFDRARRMDDRRWEPLAGLAQAALGEGKGTEALDFMATARKIAPRSDKVAGLLGKASESLGRDEEAARYYLEAIDINPNNLEFRLALGDLYLARNQASLAEAQFNKALAINSGSAQGNLGLGRVGLLRNKLGDDTLSFLSSAQRTAPDDPKTNYYLGVYHFRNKQAQEAQKYLARAAASAPDEVFYHFELGRLMYKLGNRPAAVPGFETALKLDPGYYEAYGLLAEIKASVAEFPVALKLLRTATERFPDKADAWFRLGQLQHEMGDREAARQNLAKALQLGLAGADAAAARRLSAE